MRVVMRTAFRNVGGGNNHSPGSIKIVIRLSYKVISSMGGEWTEQGSD